MESGGGSEAAVGGGADWGWGAPARLPVPGFGFLPPALASELDRLTEVSPPAPPLGYIQPTLRIAFHEYLHGICGW